MPQLRECPHLPSVTAEGVRTLLAPNAQGMIKVSKPIVGETWKPFDRPVENPGASLDRKAAATQMAALG